MPPSKKSNRREEILQALAMMLESSEGASRITTAKLAKQVGVSEAALYRHFPSKARMFEGLIEFIEDGLFSHINIILEKDQNTLQHLRNITLFILAFAEQNPGLSRIMSGHALMFENDQLRTRINQLFKRIETQLKQIIRERKVREGDEFPIGEDELSSILIAHIEGNLNHFIRSDFNYKPTKHFDAYWSLLSAQLNKQSA